MPRTSVGGIGIHYQTTGSGRDLILVHGLAANLAFWFLRIVPTLGPRFRATALDLRGHGYSDMPATGYSSAEMARDLCGVMDDLGVERADLVGHSFGGAVALHCAILFPERVRTLTLADARVHALQPLPQRGDAAYWGSWRERIGALGVQIPADMPRIAYSFLEELARERSLGKELRSVPFFGSFGMWAVEKRAGKRWLALLRTTSALRDLSDADGMTEEAIRTVRAPVFAFYGAHSHCLPTLSRIAALLPESRRVILDDVGHFHPVVRPGEFVRHLTGFLACHE